LPADLREPFELLRWVCDVDIERDDENKDPPRVACRGCPPFTPGSEGNGLQARSVLRGSFSRPGADEAVVFHARCVDSKEGGGAILLEKVDGAWKYRRSVNEGLPDPLHRVRVPDGRDVLVGYIPNPFPTRRAERVVVYDFSRPDEDAARRFVELSAFTIPALCLNRDTQAGRVHQRGAFQKLEVKDIDQDGTLDLVVTLTYARFAPDASFDRECARWLPGLLTHEDALDPLDARVLRPRKVEMTWLWKGSDFEPTPATRKLLGGESRQLLKGFD
jgi:hypothetical protein